MKCKSIIEIEKELRKKNRKNGPFVPVGKTNRDKRVFFILVARPGIKSHPLLSRPGVPGWETGTIGVSQPGQISVSLVVPFYCNHHSGEEMIATGGFNDVTNVTWIVFKLMRQKNQVIKSKNTLYQRMTENETTGCFIRNSLVPNYRLF